MWSIDWYKNHLRQKKLAEILPPMVPHTKKYYTLKVLILKSSTNKSPYLFSHSKFYTQPDYMPSLSIWKILLEATFWYINWFILENKYREKNVADDHIIINSRRFIFLSLDRRTIKIFQKIDLRSSRVYVSDNKTFFLLF